MFKKNTCILKRNKNKNKQMGTDQTYKLLQSKGNHKQKKKKPTDMKISANNVTEKGLISKIYKHSTTQYQKKNKKKPN